MSRRSEVVITGLEALTPIGNDIKTTWKSALEGRSGISYIPYVSPNSQVLYAGSVVDFDIKDYTNTKDIRDWGRSTRLAIAAGGATLKNARLLDDQNRLTGIESSYSIGCIIGSGGADATHLLDAEHERLASRRGVKPSTTLSFGLEKPPGAVAKFFGLNGHTSLVAAACASTGVALYLAERLIRSGDMDAMLVIGVEGVQDINSDGSMRYPVIVQSYESLHALSTSIYQHPSEASRPFDHRRDGFVSSEGAIGLLLENPTHARNRGVTPLAKIRTVTTNNASGDTNPEVGVMSETFRITLEASGLSLKDIDLIIPHATSTFIGDVAEKAALLAVFGEDILKIPMCAIKSLVGHLLGASGGMGLLAAVEAIRTGWIPPTINFEYTEDMPEKLIEKAGLTKNLANSQLWLPNIAKQTRVRYALSNTFGFAGHNAVTAVSAIN